MNQIRANNEVGQPSPTPSSGIDAANRFFHELQDSVESLTGIAEEHGARTLSDLMYLQAAILNGSYVDHHPDESDLTIIVGALPSSAHWLSFIQEA